MVDATEPGIIGVRDRALILLGFAGAFRRSELVGLDVAGLRIRQGWPHGDATASKTDQQGRAGRSAFPTARIPRLPRSRTVQAWIEQAGISCGPLFRSINRHGQSTAGPVVWYRRCARGEEACGTGRVWIQRSTPGIRSGPDTPPVRRLRASERSIMNQTGHRSVQMVRRYIRDGSLFRENSAGKLGL